MDKSVEVSPIEKYSGIVIQTIEEVYPKQTTIDQFRQRVSSGDPEMVNGMCGYGGVQEVAEKLSVELMEPVYSVSSGYVDYEKTNAGHKYLLLRNKSGDIIIDATAGQYIPKSSRVGYEKYFFGNMYIGSRDMLKEITAHGVINTLEAADPNSAFLSIWGDKSFELSRARII